MRVTLVVACVAVCFSSSANAFQFTPQYGGAAIETWVSNHPTESNKFIVFTAEPGPRIRRIVPDPSNPGEHLYSFETVERINPDAPKKPQHHIPNEALHHIWIAQDLSFGVAVGSNGIVLVAEDLGSSAVWREQPFPMAGFAHCWESIWSEDGQRGFVATELGICEWQNTGSEPWPQGVAHWSPVTNIPGPLYGHPERSYHSLGGEFFAGRGPLPLFRGATGVRHVGAGLSASANSIYYIDESSMSSWAEACMNPSSCSTPPLDMTCESDLLLWDIDFDEVTGAGFAVGGQRLGNGVGYAFRSTDWGQTWKQSFSQYSPPSCSLDECTGATDCPAPSAYECDKQDPVCGTAQSGDDGWPYGMWQFSTFYGVTALPDGRAVATSYGSGIWIFDPTFGTDGGWSLITDSRFFGSGPLWGVHHAESFSGSGKGEIWVAGLFSDIRHASFSDEEDEDTTISLACTWEQLAIGGGDLQGDRCPSSPWPSWYPDSCPTTDTGTPYPNWRLQDISFGSDDVGYLVGQETRIAKTEDGGASWSEQRMEGDATLFARGPITLGKVHAIDEDSVIAISNAKYDGRIGPTVFYTTNGGEPLSASVCASASTGEGWNLVEDTDMPSVDLSLMKIRDITSHGAVFWMVVDDGTNAFKLWASANGGKSWSKYSPSGITSGFKPRALAFSDTSTVYVVGSIGTSGAVLKVTSGGSGRVATELIGTSCGLPPLIDVDAYDPASGSDVVYAVGDEGTVIEFSSSAGCVTSVTSLTNEKLLRVAITDDGLGSLTVFVTGERGVVLRGDHSTSSWEALPSRSTDRLTGASFLSPELGWVAGQNSSGDPSTPSQWADASILKYED